MSKKAKPPSKFTAFIKVTTTYEVEVPGTIDTWGAAADWAEAQNDDSIATGTSIFDSESELSWMTRA